MGEPVPWEPTVGAVYEFSSDRSNWYTFTLARILTTSACPYIIEGGVAFYYCRPVPKEKRIVYGD